MVLLNLRGRGERRLRCYGHSSLINGVSVHGVRGEIVVSASSDRTIRFWNRRSCELLLTLFPFEDAQWVAWTPSGLFHASETGASLLEFQINRGAHRSPQVVPSARFPSLQRPDLIRRILQQGTATGIAVTPSPSELAEASR
jgi:WD40 repeat protein